MDHGPWTVYVTPRFDLEDELLSQGADLVSVVESRDQELRLRNPSLCYFQWED